MFVDLRTTGLDLAFDMRYATPNNFTGHTIYERDHCFLRTEAIPLLTEAVRLAQLKNVKLKIYDAFRPQKAQEKLWAHCSNPTYVMPPTKGSVHTRGVAIDLTLIDANGDELPMGTPFDDFSEQSHHGAVLTDAENTNRHLLLQIMTQAGFDFYTCEWWHYQLFDPSSYPLSSDDFGMM